MPAPSMPSRSSAVWNSEVTTIRVRPPPRSSSESSSRATWPGRPSPSKVWTTRSGGDSSLKRPSNPCTLSGPCSTKRQWPPRSTSMRSTTSRFPRPHHRATRSGSVNASQTCSRGAPNRRSLRMVRSVGVALVGRPTHRESQRLEAVGVRPAHRDLPVEAAEVHGRATGAGAAHARDGLDTHDRVAVHSPEARRIELRLEILERGPDHPLAVASDGERVLVRRLEDLHLLHRHQHDVLPPLH